MNAVGSPVDRRVTGRRRRLHRTGLGAIVAVLAAGSGLVVPLAARAAGQSPLTSSSGPLGGGVTAPGVAPTTTTSAPTVANTSTTGGSGGISTPSAIGIAVAAFVIIVGIAAAIFRDARRRTRARHGPSVDGGRVPGSQRPPKARKLSPAERRRRKRGRAPRRR